LIPPAGRLLPERELTSTPCLAPHRSIYDAADEGGGADKGSGGREQRSGPSPWSSDLTRPSGTHVRLLTGSAAVGSLGGDAPTLRRRGPDPAGTNRGVGLLVWKPRRAEDLRVA
jgi:hypothetical protein